jgi:glycosyltransferase involved in cell wall biosynthesis
LEWSAARFCDRIVTVSEFHRGWALRRHIASDEKLVAIANGLPESRLAPLDDSAAIRRGLGLDEDSFVALSTGRMAEQKGIEYLIRAVALLPPDTPDLVVLLAGSGPLQGDLESLAAELDVTDRVRFLGFRSDIGSLLAAADLVVLPSLWEGMSISLLEAMAAERPVITTTIGSNVEVTDDGDGALLVPAKDPASLAEAIYRLRTDSDLRAKLASRGAAIQRERYREETMVDAYLRLYDDLIEQTHRR